MITHSACVVAIIRVVTMMPFINSNDFTWFKVTLAKWWYVQSHAFIPRPLSPHISRYMLNIP